jgi:hypothetical protein
MAEGLNALFSSWFGVPRYTLELRPEALEH